jgi:hypothetical protein
MRGLVLDLMQEIFQIFDRDAITRAGSHYPREIGGC